MKNYYHILGLSFESSPEKQLIEAAYKALVKLYHPDVYKGDKKSLSRKIREINESYETLSNEEKKKVYDEKLKNYHMSKSFDYSDQEFEDKDVFNKKYIHLNLPSRATGAQMPDVQIIDMKDNQPLSGNWISEPMVNELKRRYENKEQAMIFLNRRGYSNLTICRTCGHRMSCKNCNSLSLIHI